jgi:ubiquinone/menaquinone biosynthesis C-methylase UbiE
MTQDRQNRWPSEKRERINKKERLDEKEAFSTGLKIVINRQKTMDGRYVHGYGQKEKTRLQDQAATLVELLHSDTAYPAACHVLEAGCGVGAQTLTLAQKSPQTMITSFDISEASIFEARKNMVTAGLRNVRFCCGDICHLPFKPESFDHLFICFVLEHLSRPVEALTSLKELLKVGGTVIVIEGDHGSAYFYPDSEAARRAIQCQVHLQKRAGGNALIGRELYPLLAKAGFTSIRVSPRMVYVDSSKPQLVEGFTKKTFIAMIEGVRNAALEAKIIDGPTFDQGIEDLYRTTEPDGVFCYTFFKAFAEKT